MDELKRNGSGYYDPTAYKAIKNLDREDRPSRAEEKRVRKLLKAIFAICEIAGFHIEERLVLKDNETGRIWR